MPSPAVCEVVVVTDFHEGLCQGSAKRFHNRWRKVARNVTPKIDIGLRAVQVAHRSYTARSSHSDTWGSEETKQAQLRHGVVPTSSKLVVVLRSLRKASADFFDVRCDELREAEVSFFREVSLVDEVIARPAELGHCVQHRTVGFVRAANLVHE